MTTARAKHGDHEGKAWRPASRAWRPRGSPLLYHAFYLFSYIVVATLAVAMLGSLVAMLGSPFVMLGSPFVMLGSLVAMFDL